MRPEPSAAGPPTRQNPDLGSQRTHLGASSSSSQVRLSQRRNGRPSWVTSSSWPKLTESMVG